MDGARVHQGQVSNEESPALTLQICPLKQEWRVRSGGDKKNNSFPSSVSKLLGGITSQLKSSNFGFLKGKTSACKVRQYNLRAIHLSAARIHDAVCRSTLGPESRNLD